MHPRHALQMAILSLATACLSLQIRSAEQLLALHTATNCNKQLHRHQLADQHTYTYSAARAPWPPPPSCC
ncbi:hypothetical protein PAHAL_3G053900 [Panicum hallii]|uniref:Secreted protein n=1 Tax=Panicum hallii TaxID=206008 RepID=A0A2T8KHC2_9POAL|nr:hypothetical protein PAHAL_3G053900 [Panicum hallii]